jgi:hypothetical protein
VKTQQMNQKFIHRVLLTVLFVLGAAGPARGDVVFVGGVDMGGTGFAAVNTLMTVQALGKQMGSIETGCVGVSDQGRLNTTKQWLNKNKQTDPDLCQGGNTGGFEKPPSKFPHNQTLPVSDASKIAVVFNSDQPAGGSVNLTKFVWVLFNAKGQVGFTSNSTSQSFSNTESERGIGNSGWEFMLDANQQALAQTAIDNGYNLLGLSATVTDSFGGPETFFLVNAAGMSVVSEPATLFLLGTGILIVGTTVRRRLLVLTSKARQSGLA